MDIQSKYAAAYIAKPEFMTEITQELGNADIIQDLLLSEYSHRNVCFALDTWYEPTIRRFQSISQAVTLLRRAGKFWYLHPLSHIRRSRLIEAQLRQCPELSRTFPLTTAIPDIGGFCLLDQNTLLYSTKRAKRWPDGRCLFIEDKINPPNRAYLKLWEALVILNKYPSSNERVLDLGAAPGGWTYVMGSFGAHVTAVDKAPLAPRILASKNIDYRQQSAFAINPATVEQVYDWVLSDVACYPQRAYELIMRWIRSGKARQLIVTIKLQGQTDMNMIALLKSIPNSALMNLYHNKHEATFFYSATELCHD
ncbi:MAG: SAM-dependent methyltransferase [Legionella sp.]